MPMRTWLGPRWNEAIGSRRCDLNPLRHEVTLGKVVVNQNGSQTYVERLPKTEDFRHDPGAAARHGRAPRASRDVLPGRGARGYLFLTRNGTLPLRADVGRDVLRTAVQRAGLQRHVTWLTLRHTAASLMSDAGLTLGEVQQRLGHKSPTTTAEVYTHLVRERFDEGRRRMEDDMLSKRRHAPDSRDRLGS